MNAPTPTSTVAPVETQRPRPRLWHVPASEVQAARAWAGQAWTAMCGHPCKGGNPRRIAAAGAPPADLSCVVCLDLRAHHLQQAGAA